MNMDHWWNDDDRHLKYSERSPSHCHFAYHKSNVNLPGKNTVRRDERPASNHLEFFPNHVLRNTSASLCRLPAGRTVHTHTTGSKLRCQTMTKHTTNICEPLRVISVKHSSVLPDDGSHKIRNMSE